MSVKRAPDGFIEVPFNGNATDQCYLGFGQRSPEEWRPAFKRTSRRKRVLAVPAPSYRGTVTVWQRINGVESRIGTARL